MGRRSFIEKGRENKGKGGAEINKSIKKVEKKKKKLNKKRHRAANGQKKNGRKRIERIRRK